ncbi:hypothetical protein [Nostoc sp.]|uniref:hypothetical protein n=1 Tax=unclassified Nostoc TaxID=2593658 RepID=UPI002FF5C912
MSSDATNVSAGGSLNMTGSAIGQSNSITTLGNVSTMVKEIVHKLPDSNDSGEPGIKELLLQLQEAIEEEKTLSAEDKTDLLEQVKALAEAKQSAESDKKEGLARKAKKMFNATLKGLPDTAKIVEASSKLLPMILKALGLTV